MLDLLRLMRVDSRIRSMFVETIAEPSLDCETAQRLGRGLGS